MRSSSATVGLEDVPWELLLQATTHRTFAEEVRGALSNGALPFWGLEAARLPLTEMLLNRAGPRRALGDLSLLRDLLTSDEGLARVARKLDLARAIRLGQPRGHELAK
jgi:dsRNA-specific ribonuclease